MFGFKRRRKALIREIAVEVVSQLSNSRGWEKFLPPVVCRDKVYMVTEDGKIYGMREDTLSGMEIITQIRNH